VLVTHGAYGRDGLLAQLAMVLKTDLTISGALHCQFNFPTLFAV
jgi:D-alanine-D-alanine ligase-like ATP-grasp enzyme